MRSIRDRRQELAGSIIQELSNTPHRIVSWARAIAGRNALVDRDQAYASSVTRGRDIDNGYSLDLQMNPCE